MPRVQSPVEKHTSDVPEEPSAAVGTERGDLVGDLNCGNDLLGLRSG
jgi:hypothetical protein